MESRNYYPLLPITSTITQIFLMVASYVISARQSHSTWQPADNKPPFYCPGQPYDQPCQPQKGLYLLALSLGAMLNFSVILLRYIQLNSIHPRKCRKTNIVSFIFGILMLFERLSVAAFFDGYTAHRFEIGNAVYVLLSFAFVVLQTHISKNAVACHPGDVVKFRVAWSAVILVCLLAHGAGRATKVVFGGRAGFLCDVSEILYHLCIVLYIGTFYWDFRSVRFRSFIVNRRSRYEVSSGKGDKIVSRHFNYIDYLRGQGVTQSSFRPVLEIAGEKDGYS